MYITLPQPFWFWTGATLWIMSQCHQTESPARTPGMPVSASKSSGCQVSLTGNTLLVVTQLPNAPFLVGELSPADALDGLVFGPVMVDNDVNWAARAERSAGGAGLMDDFVYLYLGQGLGAAIVSDGEVRRGHGGIAGEIGEFCASIAEGRAPWPSAEESTRALQVIMAYYRAAASGHTIELGEPDAV